jgi:hypothetical protein
MLKQWLILKEEAAHWKGFYTICGNTAYMPSTASIEKFPSLTLPKIIDPSKYWRRENGNWKTEILGPM